MIEKNDPKINYLINISIKMIYFAGKLIQSQGNYNWVPGWFVETLGIKGCALGIMAEQQNTVLFARSDKSETNFMEITGECLWCSPQNSYDNSDIPCHLLDCPIRQRVIKGSGQPGQEVTCFPMAGKRGFLMVCGDGLLLNSFPFSELLRAVNHIIAGCLDTSNNSGNAASYFLPSEDMAQMWSEMLAGLSHDLRTPLACIKGYATTLLREDVTWDQEAQKEFLGVIVEETDYIENLINNLLDSSTLSWRGEIELKKEPVSLPQIVNKVLRDPSYRSKSHHFTVSFPKEFPPIGADPIRIEQVIRNLVDNAVKYSMENTLVVIKGELAPGEVVVSVSDQGTGIGDEHLNRLFEKFFRVSNGIQENKKGMGLGLPLARQVLLSHGGRIWAKSKLNQGSTFYFTLPYEDTDDPG